MTKTCEGRVVIVTGAGRGIGAEHALEFARQGARVVVNDLGGAPDGSGSDATPAQEIVDRIAAAGGEAVANTDDVADWDGAGRLVQTAIDTFGRLDTLVNNAGVLRDRMFVNMSPEEWDVSMRVNLRGHFCPARHAAAYWRDRYKAGEAVDARIVNTSSGAGLMGSVGQANYGAAKAGIAGLTIIQAAELGALRHHRQRHRPLGPDPAHRGRVRRHDGHRRGRLRRHGAREHRAARRVARQQRIGRRDRSGVRGRRRPGVGDGRLAARPALRPRPPVGPRGARGDSS